MKYWRGFFGCFVTPDDFVPKHQDTIPWVEITKEEFDEWEEASQRFWIAALNGWFSESVTLRR